MIKEIKNKYVETKDSSFHGNDKCYSFRFLYISIQKLVSDRCLNNEWEHNEKHCVENIEEYLCNIPPIEVKEGGCSKYYFSDGHHRINTLKSKGINVIPCYIISPKKNTHIHVYRVCGCLFEKRVSHEECEEHKKNNRVTECRM